MSDLHSEGAAWSSPSNPLEDLRRMYHKTMVEAFPPVMKVFVLLEVGSSIQPAVVCCSLNEKVVENVIDRLFEKQKNGQIPKNHRWIIDESSICVRPEFIDSYSDRRVHYKNPVS